MTAVLGLDAAWTEDKPSGVALVEESEGKWTCVGVARSYETFVALSRGNGVDWSRPARGSAPQPGRLLEAARTLLDGEGVTLVAIDMPIANVPVTCRREADNLVSQEFGNRGCAVHSPSSHRPGLIADRLVKDLKDQGFSLAVKVASKNAERELIEVYPHPALLKLLAADYRIPYKVTKTTRYWPDKDRLERIQKLIEEHRRILAELRKTINGIELTIPAPDEIERLSSLKPYEDTLDALVCSWVGIRYLEGKAKPYGDETAAIWIPE